jgi:ketosteroid isomerase-like protein
MVGEGDKVAVEATSEGKHISGRTYTNQYHFLFEFRDGKLLRLKEYMDTERVTDVLCGGQRPPSGTGK